MLENIKLNRLEDVIYPANARLVSGSSELCAKEFNSTVPVITLSEVISIYGVECDAVLKMDCEGCEHNIIINDYESVKLFSELIFEYHVDQYRSLLRLLRVLARNYKCKIMLERKHLGIMRCTKKFSKRSNNASSFDNSALFKNRFYSSTDFISAGLKMMLVDRSLVKSV